MHRNSFIKFCLAAGAVALSPIKAMAERMRIKKGVFVRAGTDRFAKPLTRIPGDIIYNKVSSTDTKGDLYIFDTTRVQEGGPPLHFHYEQDEWWYVISGEFLIRIGDETFHAKAGDSAFGPRGVPHTFAKIGREEGKIILLFQPAGKMEQFFNAVSEGKLEKMTDEERNSFRKAHGFEHIGPPIIIPENQ